MILKKCIYRQIFMKVRIMFRLVVPVSHAFYLVPFVFPVYLQPSVVCSRLCFGCVSPACYLDLLSVGDLLFINSLLLHQILLQTHPCCNENPLLIKLSILFGTSEEGRLSYLIHCRQRGAGWREGVFNEKEERFFRPHRHPLSDQEAELADWKRKWRERQSDENLTVCKRFHFFLKRKTGIGKFRVRKSLKIYKGLNILAYHYAMLMDNHELS